DVRISVHGADRAGIVAEVTTALSAAGLNILNLESDVGGEIAKPFYVMSIEGVATLGTEVLDKTLQHLLATQPDLGVKMEPIDTMVV
ncbi:MAG: ACT domain-containing protein, partial [Pseudomonadota bacterium]|nr:ACT domain-containing protein [Pseudomonadota bacterium]